MIMKWPTIKEFNLNNPIEGKLDDIINYYVKFYGEEFRERISDKIVNTFFIFFNRADIKYKDSIDKHYKEIFNDKALPKEGQEYFEYEKKIVLDYYEKLPTQQFCREYETAKNKLLTDFIFENLGIESTEENISKITELLPVYEYFVSFSSNLNLEKKPKIFNDLFDGLASLSSDKEKIEEGLKTLSDINATSNIRRELDKLNEKKIISIVNASQLPEITDYFERLDIVCKEDILSAVSSYLLHGLAKTIGLNCATASKLKPGKTICICLNNDTINLTDDVFVHELNHSVTSTTSFEWGVITKDVGFCRDKNLEDSYVLFQDTNWQQLEAFNEVVNEYFSLGVLALMEKDNFRIGFNRNSFSAYRIPLRLFKNFFDKNIEVLKRCYINNDLKGFASCVGKRNLNRLITLATNMLNFSINFPEEEKILMQICQNLNEDYDTVDMVKLLNDKTITLTEAFKKDENLKRFMSFYREADEIFKNIDEFQAKRNVVENGGEVADEREDY